MDPLTKLLGSSRSKLSGVLQGEARSTPFMPELQKSCCVLGVALGQIYSNLNSGLSQTTPKLGGKNLSL